MGIDYTTYPSTGANDVTSSNYKIWDTGTTANDYPPLDKYQVTPNPYSDSGCWRYIFGEEAKDKPIKERKPNMETLYQVIVVTKDREVLIDTMIVAEDEDQAKLEADIGLTLKERKLKFKDVTILTVEIGDVKVRKEVQKVKIVEKDDE